MQPATVQAHIHLSDIRYVFFDIDGTLTNGNGTVVEMLLTSLEALRRAGISLGLATSQSPTEVTESLKDRLNTQPGPAGLFDGWLVLEDGHVLVKPGELPEHDAIMLTSKSARSQIRDFHKAFEENWSLADDQDLRQGKWGYLRGVLEPPVRLGPACLKEIGTLSIQEKGPTVSVPEYRGEYEYVKDWAQQTAAQKGLDLLHFVEAGNGTLRVLEKCRHKGTALLETGLDLSRTVMVGDGLNDVGAAEEVRKAGGYVVAVANAVYELKRLAHYITGEPAGLGVVEYIHGLLACMSAEKL